MQECKPSTVIYKNTARVRPRSCYVGPYYTFHWQDEDFLSAPPNYKGWFEGYDFGFKVNVRIGLRVRRSGSGIQL